MINEKDKSMNDELVKDIQVRLRKIEGQVKGIEKMVTSEACCKNILVQVAAVSAAMSKVGGLSFREIYKKLSSYMKMMQLKKKKLKS